ncbi:hypothetical protein F5Y17DRAFT_51356 [Xylariaceae sp. FL0594]|nr:hypothetical protein F5Y17DRAFT_51356 [Xylariaceae sp. FL0594]
MSLKRIGYAAIALLATTPGANAHTWVEFLYHIDSNGAFTGDPGYPIGYQPRAQGVSDDVHQNKILDTSSNPVVCKPLSSSNTAKYPPLKAAAGDYIAMQYQENGHVTQPEQTARPYRGGNVYVYGTLQHQDSDGINDVLNAWTLDGKGGNQKGKLLATHFFDDGQCYQDAPGNPIAQDRKSKYGLKELFCQTDVQLPEDLPSEGTYTLMWVWNWPRIISDSQNVTEIYSTCAQIDLTKSAKGSSGEALPSLKAAAASNNVASAGILSQLNQLVEATALGVGTNSPPPAPAVTPQPTAVASASAPVTAPADATTPADTTTPAGTAIPAASTPLTNPINSSTKTHGSHNGIKTVTVTAEAETVTQYATVTANGDPTAKPTAVPTNPSLHAEFPTTLVPVTTVKGFMRKRARVPGQARRAWN